MGSKEERLLESQIVPLPLFTQSTYGKARASGFHTQRKLCTRSLYLSAFEIFVPLKKRALLLSFYEFLRILNICLP